MEALLPYLVPLPVVVPLLAPA